MSLLVEFAPAKLNLFLAITGRRPDGFHDLVSLVAPLGLGDTLHIDPAAAFTLTCSDPEVPCDESNLVLKAARAFAQASGWTGGAAFHLEKRVPMGAGLGGGSSDGVAALRALNTLAGQPLSAGALLDVAAQLGSDCPLFLRGGPVIIRGRGERIAPLPPEVESRLRGRRVLVFKPGFGVATAWAYAQLVAGAPGSYVAASEAEDRIAAWIADSGAPDEALLFNSMEREIFRKYVAIPALLDLLANRFELRPRMSGSGSACFALLARTAPVAEIVQAIRASWGDSAFVAECQLS
jgi:4-diphosphocytidyl-2-C-methyl-D-erythritol kinase